MTSEELAKVKKRVKECKECHGRGIIGLPGQAQTIKLPCYVCKDARALLAHIEEQQKEIDHRDKIIHDLTEESTAYRLGVQEGRGEFFDLLHAEPLWATSEIPEQILEKCQGLYDNMIPPSRHQQECERLAKENEELKKQVERLRVETGTRPPSVSDWWVAASRD